jgi:lysozyme
MPTSHVIATALAASAAVAAALLAIRPEAISSYELSRSERKAAAAEATGTPPVGTGAPITMSDATVPQQAGIDVSHFNIDKDGQKITIKWDEVAKAGIDFVYIKASQGRTLKDPEFEANWAGAKAQQLPAGAYHFLSALSDPAAQARFFLSVYADRSARDLAPVVDVEWDYTNPKYTKTDKVDRWEQKTPAQIVAAVDTWLRAVASATGKTPIIYTNKTWWDARVGAAGATLGATYPVWLADYTVGIDAPAPIDGFTTVMWQTTDKGTVAGVNGNVDLSVSLAPAASGKPQSASAKTPESTESEAPASN